MFFTHPPTYNCTIKTNYTCFQAVPPAITRVEPLIHWLITRYHSARREFSLTWSTQAFRSPHLRGYGSCSQFRRIGSTSTWVFSVPSSNVVVVAGKNFIQPVCVTMRIYLRENVVVSNGIPHRAWSTALCICWNTRREASSLISKHGVHFRERPLYTAFVLHRLLPAPSKTSNSVLYIKWSRALHVYYRPKELH